jgi:glycosyltransferase involved in cell wall biosynthesis
MATIVNSLSIIVTAMNESYSLKETVDGIIGLDLDFEYEIIIATSSRAREDCKDMANSLSTSHPKCVSVYYQHEPYVAAAILESAKLAKFDFIVVMAADGETPFEVIPLMIAKMGPGVDIVATSRWLSGGSFSDYGRGKWLANLFAQKICKILYPSNLTDYTFGFRLYKKDFLTTLNYQETRHPFFLESILLPLRVGAFCEEVAVNWRPREEGGTLARKMDIVGYFRPIFKNL